MLKLAATSGVFIRRYLYNFNGTLTQATSMLGHSIFGYATRMLYGIYS